MRICVTKVEYLEFLFHAHSCPLGGNFWPKLYAYGGERSIEWMEVYCGEKANASYGTYMPEETFDAIRDFVVAIKGPLTTPVGGGIRSLNVALRQELDLYVCSRPGRCFPSLSLFTTMTTALIFGSTGAVGSQILATLLSSTSCTSITTLRH